MSQGIPNLPDLTHPNELIALGQQLIKTSLLLTVIVLGLGISIALLTWALRSHNSDQSILINEWVISYSNILKGMQHLLLVVFILVIGFLLSSTLSNRYHHWEQGKVAKMAKTFEGERLEQRAPQIRYTIKEPYIYYNWVDGKQVKMEEQREVNRFINVSSSLIDVRIGQALDPQNNRTIYQVKFIGEYQVINPLNEAQNFFLEMPPPSSYKILQNFQVEKDGTRLQQINPGDYGFPFKLQPGKKATFKVSYQSQGAPRWVYNAEGQLLSNFRLTTLADFEKADFASGIIPTETKAEGNGIRFTWIFDDNVSVTNPFGVFTASEKLQNIGILPPLLLLAPALLLWWLILLYLTIPITLIDVVIASGVFFASILSLTYLSRVIDVRIAWSFISLFLLAVSWGLGQNYQSRLAGVICTIAGLIFPVFGLIVTYKGITLSIAGLLSIFWIVARRWYNWFTPENSR